MNPEWLYLFTGVTVLSAIGFVGVAILWLRKLRETLSAALTEAANQQIRTSQRLGDSIAQLQKQQEGYTRQINVLAQAGVKLQQEISDVANRLETTQSEPRGGQTLH